MSIYLGLDISISGTGLTAVDDDYKVVHSIKLESKPEMKDVERLYFLQKLIDHHLELIMQIGDVKLCTIEIPAYQAEGRLVEIGEVTGVEKLALFKKNLPYIRVAPLQLKKYVSGVGKGGKSLILLDVFKNFHEEFRDDNIADAYVLARIARDYYYLTHNQSVDVKKYQEEVLKNLIKSNVKTTLL